MVLSLAGIFAAGLLTFVTPCVLPLIPIYLSAMVGGDVRQLDVSGRGQLLARASLFALGFIAVFTLLGLTASSVSAALGEHRALVEGAGALLILLFGLKFLGVVRLPWLDRIARSDESRLKTRFAWVNAVLMGVVFAAGWSPCVGPVLGSVLSYTASKTSDPLLGAGYLATYGLGFALPLVVTAAFAELGIRLLRRIHPHLARIERAIGVLLVIVSGSLLWDLGRSAEPTSGAASLASEARAAAPDGPASTPLMMEFYSADCPICRAMKPVVDEITEECHGKGVNIVAYDLSKPELRHVATEYRLVGVPTFVFVDTTGAEVARLVGHQTKQALKQAIAAVRGEACPGVGPLPGDEPMDAHRPPDHAACDLDAAALAAGRTDAVGSCDDTAAQPANRL